MDSGIYLITNLGNGKVYVGSSKDLKTRKRTHCHLIRKEKHINPHLQRAFNQDGEASFQWDVLIYCDEKDLLYWEDWWMGRFDSRNVSQGYNLLSADRREVSEETRRKIGEAQRGRKWPPGSRAERIGWHHTEETKAKIGRITSAALTGRPSLKRGTTLSAETRAKVSASLTGKIQSQETRAKRSASCKGKKQTEEVISRKSKRMMGHTVSEESRSKISASLTGRKLTEETRLKLKGRTPWNKGIPMSEEQKAIQATAHKGKKHTEESKAKMSKNLTGRACSEETRAKISASNKAWRVKMMVP